MKYSHIFFISLLISLLGLSSCDDDVSTVGSSLITDKSEIIIDSSFVASGFSVRNLTIQSRTSSQLIGRIQAKGFGNLSSEFVTQFMPAMNLDTAGVSANDIEYMEMLMFFDAGSFTGDSVAPMGLKVYPLTKQLPSPIYSDFDPQGYYDEANPWESKIYTGNALHSDSLNNLSYRTISVKLPIEFAKSFYNEYLTNPQTFATPSAFAKFFPGIYVKNSFGEGRVTNIKETRVNMHYMRHDTYVKDSVERDTVYHLARSYMAVTPEVISNNIIRLDVASQIEARVNAGEAILMTPAGFDVELKFPAKDVLNSYRSQAGKLAVINSLSLSIPADTIANIYGIDVPSNVLIVLKKDKADFFAKNSLTDNITSFLATYNSTTKSYDVSNMREYLIDLLSKDTVAEEDYVFTITPVDVTTETSSNGYYTSSQTYVTAIAPYVSGPTMAKLNLAEAKIKLTFGKQSANF